MSLEELRRRLEALNRAPLPTARPLRPHIPSPPDQPAASHVSRVAERLERLIEGSEVQAGPGRCYSISRRLSRCWPANPRIGCGFPDTLADARQRLDALDRDLSALVEAGPDELLFVDLETCGFAGTPVFLIGTMWYADGDLHVEQLLARNYQEEPAILARFADLGRRRTWLTTFNGKSFDWPFLRDRAAVWRVELAEPRDHCDLLHVARRRYRGVVPDCKLQTLELYVCKRRRVDDIPGSNIPAAYHDFVGTGFAGAIRQVVHHNFLDLVTMAELVMDMLGFQRQAGTG